MENTDYRETALNVIKNSPFPFLATVDGNVPRVRPVSPVKLEEFTVWVASVYSSGKTEQIRSNSNVELCFMTEGHEQVRITGEAVEVHDHDTRIEIWTSYKLLQKYFKDPDDPGLIIYEINPTQVRYLKEWGMEYEEVQSLDIS